MWDPGNSRCNSAGPPLVRHGLIGKRRSTCSDKRGGCCSAGPPQAKQSPLGGQRSTRSDKRGGHLQHGFTLIELLLVVSLIVMASAGVVFSMRDTGQSQLEREAQRVIALLESARAQSRATGVPVFWQAGAPGFEFTGLPASKAATASTPAVTAATEFARQDNVTPWLNEGISVQGTEVVTLGPEPILARQQIVLLLGGRSLRIVTDGLRPFAVDTGLPAAPEGATP